MKHVVVLATLALALSVAASTEETPRPRDECSVDQAIELVCDGAAISARIDRLWTAFKIKSPNPSKMGVRPGFSFVLSATQRVDKGRRVESESRASDDQVVVYATPEEMVRFLSEEEGFISCVVIRELLFVHGRRVGTLAREQEKTMRTRMSCEK